MVATLNRQIARLQGTKIEMEALDKELSHKKQIIKLVIGERPPPTAAWFLAWLGEAVPSDLVVTNLQIARKDDYYTVLISGAFQAPLQPGKTPAQQIVDPVAVFKANLARAPFHLKIKEKENEQALQAPAQAPKTALAETTGIPAWLSRLTAGSVAKSVDNKPIRRDNFLIEGIMR